MKQRILSYCSTRLLGGMLALSAVLPAAAIAQQGLPIASDSIGEVAGPLDIQPGTPLTQTFAVDDVRADLPFDVKHISYGVAGKVTPNVTGNAVMMRIELVDSAGNVVSSTSAAPRTVRGARENTAMPLNASVSDTVPSTGTQLRVTYETGSDKTSTLTDVTVTRKYQGG